jgi:hypothetical protein
MMCREIEFGVAVAQHALLDAKLSDQQREPESPTAATTSCRRPPN